MSILYNWTSAKCAVATFSAESTLLRRPVTDVTFSVMIVTSLFISQSHQACSQSFEKGENTFDEGEGATLPRPV